MSSHRAASRLRERLRRLRHVPRSVTALRVLSIGDWLIILSIVLAAATIAALVWFAVDSARARSDVARISQQQAELALDARNRATRRIDMLQDRIDALTQRIEESSRESGRLQQAVQDLAEQVRQLGGEPVTRRSQSGGAGGASSPARTAGPRPTSSPRPSSGPTPAPTPTPAPSDPTGPCLPLLGCL